MQKLISSIHFGIRRFAKISLPLETKISGSNIPIATHFSILQIILDNQCILIGLSIVGQLLSSYIDKISKLYRKCVEIIFTKNLYDEDYDNQTYT